MRICVYPGSFDPFTEGHMDVLRQAVRLFDLVYVGVLDNIAKHPLFSAEDRADMIRAAVRAEEIPNAKVEAFSGLLVQFARSVGAEHIIRGLRATTDFEYEFQIDAMNRHLAPEIQTVYVMAKSEHSFLSSSAVKEIAVWGGKIDGLVPDCIAKTITDRLGKHE